MLQGREKIMVLTQTNVVIFELNIFLISLFNICERVSSLKVPKDKMRQTFVGFSGIAG